MSKSKNFKVPERLTPRQANFLAYLEQQQGGRPEEVTRKQLRALEDTWTPHTVGPFNHQIRWPAWLTGTRLYTTSRGVYKLPWSLLDAFLVARTAREIEKAEKANRNSEKTTVSTGNEVPF